MTLIKFKNGNGVNSYSNFNRGIDFPSFFNDTLDRLWKEEATVNWMPAVNIKERAEDFKIDLAVPGMNKENFKVEVDNGILTVSGERKEEKSEENEKVTRTEFHYGSFKRAFNLPDTADVDKIAANYKDGLLSLTVGKREDSRLKPKKQITIE
ncbi:MAG: Hsp20/alpha crystallin family protein [Bacteroidetes bacterium]|nr:Hsp20/alpha crystallin family protein [Bacteroidota bacterium]